MRRLQPCPSLRSGRAESPHPPRSVDNVFLLSHELDQQNARSYRQGSLLLPGDDDSASDLYLAVEERVARTLARVGPSILLSATCETVAFALGTLVGMPAVTNFAIYAAGAVIVNTVLQCTLLISLLALDLHRVEVRLSPLSPSLRCTRTVRLTLPPSSAGESGRLASRPLSSHRVSAH